MSRNVGVPMRRLVIASAILLMHGQPAEAFLLWNWSYSGNGVSASGTFTTNDAPDEAGFYRIVAITGADNGVTITGLQPKGTAIPDRLPMLFAKPAWCRGGSFAGTGRARVGDHSKVD